MRTKEKKISTNGQPSINMIGVGTRIEGEIFSESDFRIDGTVKGTVKTNSRLVVGKDAKIEGDVEARFMDISGTVSGNVQVTEMLSLKSSAVVEGDLSTGQLYIEAGARFNGKCQMGQSRSDDHSRESKGVREGRRQKA